MENNTQNRELPITVAQSKLADEIIKNINESNLHPAIIMPVIEEIYTMMKNVLAETRKNEKETYEKYTKENTLNESK